MLPPEGTDETENNESSAGRRSDLYAPLRAGSRAVNSIGPWFRDRTNAGVFYDSLNALADDLDAEPDADQLRQTART